MKTAALTLALTTTASIGLSQSANAQIGSADTAGIPYEITFNGSLYPADLDQIEYPYIAASQERDGECILKIISDASGDIASMSVVSCSDDLFEGAASRYIRKQEFSQHTNNNLTVHNLRVRWDIGEQSEEVALQLATRD